jgi:two-component system, OmpR family, sensor histidine kinase MtrB
VVKLGRERIGLRRLGLRRLGLRRLGLRRLGLRRFGLRGRVVLGFGLVSCLLATALAVIGWFLVSTFLVNQRFRAAVRTATEHAAILDDGLRQTAPDVPKLLDSLPTALTSSVLLRYHGQWYGGLPAQGEPAVPDELTALVAGGTAATQRIGSGDQLVLAVGIPLRRSGGAFFELFSLDDLHRTLQLFSVALVAGVIVFSLINTGVGWFASRLAMRPFTELTAIASAVAAGDLDARMPGEEDPDLRGLARSFNHTVETLRQRVAADARFAGDVSHELRTPLTTMINSMELIQNRRAELPRTVLEPVDLLVDDLDRFRRLVVDLIEISKHDSGVAGDLEGVVVADLVRQAADAAAGRIVTSVLPSADGVRIWADKRRLERVFTNLVENAERHGRGCTAVTVNADGEHVTVTVDDAGPGVPVDRRERIFERFARAGITGPGESSGAGSSGVGLGLAIVERHVHWHGGIITVADRPGGGARFVVSLPLRRREAA